MPQDGGTTMGTAETSTALVSASGSSRGRSSSSGSSSSTGGNGGIISSSGGAGSLVSTGLTRYVKGRARDRGERGGGRVVFLIECSAINHPFVIFACVWGMSRMCRCPCS